jgi:hypothetical protein
MAMTPAEANAAGLAWVDENHPLYGTKGFAGYNGGAAAPSGSTTAARAGTTTNGTVQGQAANASTYSQTPAAAPLANTANQGAQDVLRNSYLQQATQSTTIDRNDPNFRQQADAFGATQDRARRQYQSEAAERLSAQGLGNSGAMEQERRFADERAATAQGSFEAQLVGRELENRRAEIKDSLAGLRGIISNDQALAMQKQLAELDAAIKRESLAQSGSLGSQELGIKDKLGTGALNVDLLRALLQNQQFGTESGIRIGEDEMNYYLRSAGL